MTTEILAMPWSDQDINFAAGGRHILTKYYTKRFVPFLS